jgi:hypothetical protein
LDPKVLALLDTEENEGGFLSKFDASKISRARIVGAAMAGVGAYVTVRIFQKTGGDILREIAGVFNWIAQGITGQGFDPIVSGFGEAEEIFTPEPFAIAIGLTVGGMLLAGQNPGELLKGIGEIIPG